MATSIPPVSSNTGETLSSERTKGSGARVVIIERKEEHYDAFMDDVMEEEMRGRIPQNKSGNRNNKLTILAHTILPTICSLGI